ncbi:hypothetical protein HF086_008668 [Spodoptera exigua]|uniref:Uncharacterized protein n=1 Tax=Spodoptera exigua TaxID=7107 RepID=A0A922SNV9_SPOEX|nr:hypothetical protein HF086_008668 [Spodoptera exigua]
MVTCDSVVTRDWCKDTTRYNDLRSASVEQALYEAVCVFQDGVAVPNAYIGCGNGREGRMSPNAAAAAAVAAVAHGLRRQMCNMVAGQRPPDHPPHMGPPMQSSPQLTSPLSTGLESPLCSPPPPGHALEPAKHPDPFRPFASPTESRYSDRDTASDITLMGPPKNGQGHARKSSGQGSSPSELDAVDGRADI